MFRGSSLSGLDRSCFESLASFRGPYIEDEPEDHSRFPFSFMRVSYVYIQIHIFHSHYLVARKLNRFSQAHLLRPVGS